MLALVDDTCRQVANTAANTAPEGGEFTQCLLLSFVLLCMNAQKSINGILEIYFNLKQERRERQHSKRGGQPLNFWEVGCELLDEFAII